MLCSHINALTVQPRSWQTNACIAPLSPVRLPGLNEQRELNLSQLHSTKVPCTSCQQRKQGASEVSDNFNTQKNTSKGGCLAETLRRIQAWNLGLLRVTYILLHLSGKFFQVEPGKEASLLQVTFLLLFSQETCHLLALLGWWLSLEYEHQTLQKNTTTKTAFPLY